MLTSCFSSIICQTKSSTPFMSVMFYSPSSINFMNCSSPSISAEQNARFSLQQYLDNNCIAIKPMHDNFIFYPASVNMTHKRKRVVIGDLFFHVNLTKTEQIQVLLELELILAIARSQIPERTEWWVISAPAFTGKPVALLCPQNPNFDSSSCFDTQLCVFKNMWLQERVLKREQAFISTGSVICVPNETRLCKLE